MKSKKKLVKDKTFYYADKTTSNLIIITQLCIRVKGFFLMCLLTSLNDKINKLQSQ